jgi:hypothetical protein
MAAKVISLGPQTRCDGHAVSQPSRINKMYPNVFLRTLRLCGNL